MLLGTLGASLIGNILPGKGMNRVGEGEIAKRQGRGFVKSVYGNKKVRKTTTKSKKNFYCCLILKLILKYKNIIIITRSEVRRTKQDLMVFVLEIIYPK